MRWRIHPVGMVAGAVAATIAALSSGAISAAGSGERGAEARFTVQQAAALVSIVPRQPTLYAPYKSEFSFSDSLAVLVRDEGNCDSPTTLTPERVCLRWRTKARKVGLLGGPAHRFSGKRIELDENAYVFRDERGARQGLALVKDIWTLKTVGGMTLTASALGPDASGIAGYSDIAHLSQLAVRYFWRVHNVVFAVSLFGLETRPSRSVESSFLKHAVELDRLARAAR